MTESRFPAGERINITFKMVFRKIKDSEETEIQEKIKNRKRKRKKIQKQIKNRKR